VEDERVLLQEHAIEIVVAKNAGGEATAPKLVAARDAGIEVVMVDRPAAPDGIETVATVDRACEWVEQDALGVGAPACTPTSPGRDPR